MNSYLDSPFFTKPDVVGSITVPEEPARDRKVLAEGFEDIKLLMQYLYARKEHAITITNSIGVSLRIRMSGDGHYRCRNLNFPEFPETDWTKEMSVPTMLAVIEQLKDAPPEQQVKGAKNRWEEIKAVCGANECLNKEMAYDTE